MRVRQVNPVVANTAVLISDRSLHIAASILEIGAGDGIRTHDPNLGNVEDARFWLPTTLVVTVQRLRRMATKLSAFVVPLIAVAMRPEIRLAAAFTGSSARCA